jgi:hypothetical protein
MILLARIVSIIALVFAFSGSAGAGEAARDWESTVAAAEKEGQVAVYMGGEVSQMRIRGGVPERLSENQSDGAVPTPVLKSSGGAMTYRAGDTGSDFLFQTI